MIYIAGMTKLAEHLRKNKITQVDFAAAVGSAQGIVSRLAAGKGQPGPELAARIDRATGGAVPFHSWPAYSAFADLHRADTPSGAS